jgi:hypothetical protein
VLEELGTVGCVRVDKSRGLRHWGTADQSCLVPTIRRLRPQHSIPGVLVVHHRRGSSSAAPRRKPGRMADHGTAAGASAGAVKTALEAAMLRVQETAGAWVRLSNDLSAKPNRWNPMMAGSPTAGSQMGSQRRQTVTDSGRPQATVNAAKWHVEPRSPTFRDCWTAPCKRQVSGSNPLTGSSKSAVQRRIFLVSGRSGAGLVERVTRSTNATYHP